MANEERFAAFAEAVADGAIPDWPLDSSSLTPDDRQVLANLRALASISHVFATATESSRSAAFPPSPPPLASGSQWGHLRVLETVGRGRSGQVYRAYDPALARDVALKLVPHRDGEDAAESQVVEEGRLMARVRHPNVVTIHGAQRIDRTSGLWMEFIEGRTLAAELEEQGPFGADELMRVGTELCQALKAVHGAGLVHRDVKAHNVLRETTGRVVLGDFGTGRELDDESHAQGGMAGTPAYLAPEIFDGRPASPCSDLYSLGVLLFHLATRRYPVEGRTLSALREAHANRGRRSPRVLRADLPDGLCGVIETAISNDPSKRFQTAEQMAAALARCQQRRAGSRQRWVVAVLSIALILAVSTGVWLARQPAAALPLVERDTVLVTAAINRTGESVLDGTIEYALERELSQSAFISVAPRARVADVLQLMQKPADAPLDASTSREVALRDGAIRALVTGRVEKVGGTYQVSVDLIDPSDGARLASVSERPVQQSELLKAIGRAAITVRRRLGEGLPPTEARRLELARVTTPSLRALQLHSQVRAMLDGEAGIRNHAAAAEQLLREAIAEDPGFAAGHNMLAEVIRIQSSARLDEVLDHINQAIALSDRVTEVERLGIEGALAVRARMTDDPAERQRWLEYGIAKQEAILQLKPNNYGSLVILTNLYAQVGRPNAGLAMRLSDLRPRGFEWAGRAVSANLWAGDLDAARHYAQRGSAVDVVSGAGVDVAAWLRLFDAYAAWLRNDAVTASAVADRTAAGVEGLPPASRSAVAGQLAYWYLTLGRLKAAETLAPQIESQNWRKMLLLYVAAARGDSGLIGELLDREYPRLEDATGVITAIIQAGRIDEARGALRLLRKQPQHNLTYAAFIEGQIALGEGRIDDAVEGIDAHFKRVGPGQAHFVAELLARALAARGDTARAIAVVESFSAPRSRMFADPRWLPIHWVPLRNRLAVLYRQVGRHSEADGIEAELRALLVVADDDHPIKRRLSQ